MKNLAPVPQSIDAYGSNLDDQEKALYWKMTVDYGRRNMMMCADWAKDCIEQLEKLPRQSG